MKAQLRAAAAGAQLLAVTAWGYRWMALCLLLFWTGQATPWPWTLVQAAADILLTALIAYSSRQAWAWLLCRRLRSSGDGNHPQLGGKN